MKVPSHDLDVFLFFSYFLIFAPPSSVGMRGSLSPLSLPSPCPQSVLFCFCFSLSPVSGRGNETKRIVTFFYFFFFSRAQPQPSAVWWCGACFALLCFAYMYPTYRT